MQSKQANTKTHGRLAPLLRLASLLTLFALTVISCSRDSDPTINLNGLTMGTTWSVKAVPDVSDESAAAKRQAIWDLVDAQLNAVNDRMSHYLETSEISQFNNSSASTPFSISQDTADVLREALRIGEITSGALDITVGPLVDAWGFGPPGEPPESPSNKEIEQLLKTTGLEHLHLDIAASTLTKDNPAVRINLSSIAKGYGVDRVADALLDAGYNNFMVEIGGEVRVNGHRTDGQPWHVAVERPQLSGRSLQEVLTLNKGSLATSGDYRIFRELDGRRVSHIIDPHTGRPVDHSLASVSVFDSLCIRADGFATALLVLGPDRGFELAEELELAALFLTRNNRDQIEEKATTRFKELLMESSP
jgi:thiamine biosynthesis lipoprotein